MQQLHLLLPLARRAVTLLLAVLLLVVLDQDQASSLLLSSQGRSRASLSRTLRLMPLQQLLV